MCSYWRARFVPGLTPRGGTSYLLSVSNLLLSGALPGRPAMKLVQLPAPAQGHAEPQAGHEYRRADTRDDRCGGAEQHVRDEDQDPGQPSREEGDPDDCELGPELHQVPLLVATEQESMMDRRRDQHGGGDRDADQGHEVL